MNREAGHLFGMAAADSLCERVLYIKHVLIRGWECTFIPTLLPLEYEISEREAITRTLLKTNVTNHPLHQFYQ